MRHRIICWFLGHEIHSVKWWNTICTYCARCGDVWWEEAVSTHES